MKVELFEYPGERDWLEVKRRALVTVGKSPIKAPDIPWRRRILRARHSPIRRLFFAFYLELPYCTAMHLVRHVHTQPYVKSQRNDRQDDYDRESAPQNATVKMIWDMNGEALMIVANKRLCRQAEEKTRAIVAEMCKQVLEKCPEYKGQLVPICVRERGCNEMFPCDSPFWGKTPTRKDRDVFEDLYSEITILGYFDENGEEIK